MGPIAARLPLRGCTNGLSPRVAVVGRHLAVTQVLRHGRFDSCPADSGPNAHVAVHLLCKEDEDGSSPSGSTGLATTVISLMVAGQPSVRTWRNW